MVCTDFCFHLLCNLKNTLFHWSDNWQLYLLIKQLCILTLFWGNLWNIRIILTGSSITWLILLSVDMALLHFIVLILHCRRIDVVKKNYGGIFYIFFNSRKNPNKPRLQKTPTLNLTLNQTLKQGKEALFMPSIQEKQFKNSSFLD